MIVGTAGHIDHGKSALVRRLTGTDPDRLKEEKERGITIDLGFAYWPQPDGGSIGFVDVPGHEALVHNMLAGATGIDLVLLVVAADDGIMPQTREHLAIMDLLGMRRGIVALNKCDRVPTERIAAIRAEVEAALSGTGLAEAPILPVSALTGSGMDALASALTREHAACAVRPSDGAFRLAVDRVFTLKGQGTAVSGTVVSGKVAVDDEVVVTPSGLTVRVRSIHAQNRPAGEGLAGQRCALVLTGSGVEKDRLRRGDVVAAPGLAAPTSRLDARLEVLASEAKPVGTWFPVKLHHGADEVPARLVPLEGSAVAPGTEALVQIVLERPAAVWNGDRFVVRDTSSSRTVGGGVVLDVRAPDRRRRTPERLAVLRALAHPEPVAALAALLAAGPATVDIDGFVRDRALAPALRDALIAELGLIVLGGEAPGVAVAPDRWQEISACVTAKLADTHASRPDLPGIGREQLRQSLPVRLSAPVFSAVVARLVAESHVVAERGWVRRPDHVVRFSAEEERLWQRVLQRILAEPYRPPRVRDIAKAMGIDEGLVRRLAKMAARRGDVEEIAHDHFFGADVVARMAEIAIEVARAAPKGEFSAAELRDRLDNGRKVAIQVLEFFDRHGFTIRRRDLRRINTHRAAMFATRAGVPTGAKPVATHTDAAAKQAFPAHAAAEPRPIGLQITGALR